MSNPLQNQKAAVESGQWILYRYNPDKIKLGENPLTLDSRPRKTTIEEYMMMENRFKMLVKSKPALAKQYMDQAQKDADDRFKHFQYLAAREGDKIEN
jgi:pyruvate-ferredoxin/flavodoxin oxidoreductase